MSDLNFDKLGSEKVESMFEECFEEQIGRFNNIAEFEAKCERDTNDGSVKVNLTIIGLAGCPTMEDYLEGNVEDIEEIVVGDDDYGTMSFELSRDDCAILNPNDYVVVYKS